MAEILGISLGRISTGMSGIWDGGSWLEVVGTTAPAIGVGMTGGTLDSELRCSTRTNLAGAGMADLSTGGAARMSFWLFEPEGGSAIVERVGAGVG